MLSLELLSQIKTLAEVSTSSWHKNPKASQPSVASQTPVPAWSRWALFLLTQPLGTVPPVQISPLWKITHIGRHKEKKTESSLSFDPGFQLRQAWQRQIDWQADYFMESSRLCPAPVCWNNDERVAVCICTGEEPMIRVWLSDSRKTGYSGAGCEV